MRSICSDDGVTGPLTLKLLNLYFKFNWLVKFIGDGLLNHGPVTMLTFKFNPKQQKNGNIRDVKTSKYNGLRRTYILM